MALKVMRNVLVSSLTADVTSGGDFFEGDVRLFKNDAALNPATTELDDLTEADFPGYAAVQLSWGTVYADAVGTVQVDSQNVQYVCGSMPSGQTVYGYYITASGGELLGAERFTNARPLASELDSVSFVVSLNPAMDGSHTLIV